MDIYRLVSSVFDDGGKMWENAKREKPSKHPPKDR